MSAALSASIKSASQSEGLDRLFAAAVDAWGKFPSANMGGLRRDHVTQQLKREMTYALIMGWQPARMAEAVGWLLNQARDRIERDAVKTAGRDQKSPDIQLARVPANRSGVMPVDDGGHKAAATPVTAAPIVANANAGRDRRGGEARLVSKPSFAAPSASLKRLADIQQERAYDRFRMEVKLSRLDTVLIDGKKIGDCTVAEVRSWAATRMADAHAAARDARFALSLVANLPSGAVIRDWWKNSDEIDDLYKRAEIDNVA